jgi:abortive infection bacteriophage resistance protein
LWLNDLREIKTPAIPKTVAQDVNVTLIEAQAFTGNAGLFIWLLAELTDFGPISRSFQNLSLEARLRKNCAIAPPKIRRAFSYRCNSLKK